MSKITYISGAVTGLPKEAVKQKFSNATLALRTQGYKVLNPIDLLWNAWLERQSREMIMKACIILMMQCDEIHMLPDWASSKGATLERDIAHRLGMPIIYL